MGFSSSEFISTPRQERFEGEWLSPIKEIEFDDADDCDLPDRIIWSDGSWLEFEQIDQSYSRHKYGQDTNVKLFKGVHVFRNDKDEDVRAELSETSNRKPTYFTGSRNGFYAHDPELSGKKDNLFLVGIDPRELESSIKHKVALDHEMGHVFLMDNQADLSLLEAGIRSQNMEEVVPYAGIMAYVEELAKVIPKEWKEQVGDVKISRKILGKAIRADHEVDMVLRLFHERFAWAAGINMKRGRGTKDGFEIQSTVMDYAKFCLQTYVDHYKEQAFVKGLKGKN